MRVPVASPGLVFRYDYLWRREAEAGREHGKERPACLVAAIDLAGTPQYVVVLPITHAQPRGDTVGIEVPARVRAAIGLDDAPCWIIVSEHNVDGWPNSGIAPIPGRPGVFAYGFIPPGLFAQVKAAFLGLSGAGAGGTDRR